MAVWNVINHTELGASGAGSMDWSSIPSSYDHLCIVASVRGDTASHCPGFYVRFNNDSGANYNNVRMDGYDTGGISSAESTDQTSADHGKYNGASSAANCFTPIELWIFDYANTSRKKAMHGTWNPLGTSVTGWQWAAGVHASQWESTAAINQVTIFPDADDFVQYSAFTLYGIEGA